MRQNTWNVKYTCTWIVSPHDMRSIHVTWWWVIYQECNKYKQTIIYMYRVSQVIYIIITISTARYFNQSLPVSYTTGSSYRSSYSSRTHPKMAYRSLLFIPFYYVNWNLNGQGALIRWVYPVQIRDHGLKQTPVY